MILSWFKAACGIAACGLLVTVAQAQSGKNQNADWTMGGQNLKNTRDQATTKISASNIAKLTQKWVFQAGGSIQATPAVANGIVYFPDFAGNFYALDATSGVPVWQKTVSNWTGIPGDYARNDPVVVSNMVILGNQAGSLAKWSGSWTSGSGAWVIAADANTGALIWKTQVDAFPATMITGSPVVYKNTVVVGVASAEEGTAANPNYPCCTSRGSVVALDLNTGKLLWKTYTVPDNNGQTGGYSGGGVWGSTPVVDAKRNSVYVGVGNNYSVPVADEACAATNPAANCYAAGDYFDSVMALDLTTGAIKWASHALPYDAWNVACITPGEPATNNCPKPTGPDYDFGGSGPNMFTVGTQDLIGIGQKSGIYWAFNPDTGAVVWNTQVGPGSALGGIEWGTATDGQRIYVPISNWYGVPYGPSNAINGGSWAALDPATGAIKWQTATPGTCYTVSGTSENCMALSAASVANGVVFAGSMDTNSTNPTMFALDAGTGNILWSFAAGSTVIAAPAIVGDSVYWGSGSNPILASVGLGTLNNKLYAFSVK